MTSGVGSDACLKSIWYRFNVVHGTAIVAIWKAHPDNMRIGLLLLVRCCQVMKQLERMFGEGARSALTFSSHRWGEQPLTSGNGGGTGGGHDDMGDPELRVPFVSGPVAAHDATPRTSCFLGVSYGRAPVAFVQSVAPGRWIVSFQSSVLDNGKLLPIVERG